VVVKVRERLAVSKQTNNAQSSYGEVQSQEIKVKLQWLQDPREINGDNLNNKRCETSRHFRNKKREYLKNKIYQLAMNSKNKNIRDLYRGIDHFKRGY
jgi:uncharacterized protein YaaR (DUF327 family)